MVLRPCKLLLHPQYDEPMGKPRRILYRDLLKAQETYYMLLKTCWRIRSAEFDFDFFELVPRSVYAGVDQEDIW